jgi:hypothetical protein
MEKILRPIDVDQLDRVTGGADDKPGIPDLPGPVPTPKGGDGDSIARNDRRLQPLEDKFKGKTKGQG